MHPLRRFAHRRPRLLIAIAIGLLLGIVLPDKIGFTTRALAAWNVGGWFYLISTGWLVFHTGPERIRASAVEEDNSAAAVLTIMSCAAMVSLLAIVLELAGSKNLSFADKLWHYGFTASTVLCSWLMVSVLFTFHYAHVFYRSPGNKRALAFPEGDIQPDYWDFLYFSFTIAVAAQTSDISVKSPVMRKVVLAQSILSFLFNAAILGLSINIAAGLVGS
jgi:uncharacterized membrane protein